MSRRQLLRVPELSLQESVVGTALFKMDNHNELLCSTRNSAQLYDSLDGRSVFGTMIHGYIRLSPFTVHLKLRILLISYTQYKIKLLNEVWIVGMQEDSKGTQPYVSGYPGPKDIPPNQAVI